MRRSVPCLPLLLLLASATGEAQPAAPVHVLVQVRRSDGQPLASLHSNNFQVTAPGTRLLGVSLHKSSSSPSATPHPFPSSALLIVSSSSPFAVSGNLINLLQQPQWNDLAGDALALVGPDGRAAGFAPGPAALRAELATQPARYRGYLQALRDLAARPGRRAVFYFTGAAAGTPLDLARAAQNTGAQVYQVGGDPARNDIVSSYQTTTDLPTYGRGIDGNYPAPGGAPTIVNTTVIWQSIATPTIRTVRIAPNLSAALRDYGRDTPGFYDLTLNPPPPPGTLTLALHTAGRYQFTAETYTLDGTTAPPLQAAGNYLPVTSPQ